jgi:acetyl esterase/lipase
MASENSLRFDGYLHYAKQINYNFINLQISLTNHRMKLITLVTMTIIFTPAISQDILPLYENGDIPNSIQLEDTETSKVNDGILMVTNVTRPTLTVYLPTVEKATGDAIVVCPGGGYGMVAAGHEGEDVARKLNELGIAAFVLKYRLPDSRSMPQPEIGPLQDAQRALLMVRENAGRWKINPRRIGILGFSAGGHLASTVATHFKKSYLPRKYRTGRRQSLRPDFCVLVYPVISFSDSIGHAGSRENLLGKNPSAEKVREYSNELQVTPNTPPTFLIHAKDDWLDYRNTTVYADALNNNGVLSEVLLYEKGGHGFGLINPESDIQWIERMAEWLKRAQ